MPDILQNLYYRALIISDYGRKTFGESDLEKVLGLNKNHIVTILKENSDAFNFTQLKKSFCPECNKQFVDTSTGFCGGCGATIDLKNINQYRINLNKTGFINKSLEFICKFFEENAWCKEKNEVNFLLMKKDEYHLAVSFSLDDSSLKDYYSLKGWLPSTKNVCFLLISKSNDNELARFASKTAIIQLESSVNIFSQDKKRFILSKIAYCLENILQENKFENAIKGSFKEELDIREIQTQVDTILEDLGNLALHNNTLSESVNGYKYQSSIIKLFNLTILPIKVLAKKNIQDILIRVPQNYGATGRQVRWIPLEIKSFRPTQKIGPYFKIKDTSFQHKNGIREMIWTRF